jgi:hypothetical protein
LNSQMKDGVTSGTSSSVCLCNENYYRELKGKEMTCNKCRTSSTSLAGSTSPNDCICDKGSYLSKSTCLFCDDDEYLDNTSPNRSHWACATCPLGATCKNSADAANIRGLLGWWEIPVSERSGDMFAKCLNPDACLGGSKSLNNGSCSTKLGFLNESRLCQACARGYSRTKESSCASCENSDGSDKSTLIAFAIFVIVIFFFSLNVLRLRSFRSFDAQRRRKALHSTIKRIVLSHLQMIGIVLGLSVQWPKLMEDVLATASSIASFADGVNNVKCFYKDTDQFEFFNGVLIFTAIGPIVMAGMIAVYWLVLVHLPCTSGKLKCGASIERGSLCPKKKATKPTTFFTEIFTADQKWYYLSSETGESVGPLSVIDMCHCYISTDIDRDTMVWHEDIENEEWAPVQKVSGLVEYFESTTKTIILRNKQSTARITYKDTDAFVSSAVLLWYISLPSLLHIGSGALKCYKIGDKSYVFINLEKECFVDDHLWYSVLVACPMIFFYGVLLPGLFMLHLRRAGSSRLTDASLMLRWGMLHSGYRESKYWWELVVMLRKYFIIGLVTFQNRGEFQLHVALGVIVLALHFHDSQHPFGHRRISQVNGVLHRYEMASLLIILFMLWTANFFSLDVCRYEPFWCSFMVFLVLGSNFLFLGLLFFIFLKEFCKRNELHKKFQKISSLLLDTSHQSHAATVHFADGVDQSSINPMFRNGEMKSVEMSVSATNTAYVEKTSPLTINADFEIKINDNTFRATRMEGIKAER